MHANDFTSGPTQDEALADLVLKPQTFSSSDHLGEYILDGSKVVFAPGVVVDIIYCTNGDEPITAEIVEKEIPERYIDPDYCGAAFITDKSPKGGLFAFWLRLKGICNRKLLNEHEANLKEQIDMVSAEPPKVVMTKTGILANIMKFRVDARHENPKGAARRAAIAFRKELAVYMAEEAAKEAPVDAETSES